MKRIVLLAFVVIVMIFATACGGSTTTATQAPVSQSAGQTAATGASSAANGTEVDVTLGDNTIASSLTTFKVGVPYTFVITNNGNHNHNFNIAKPVSVTGGIDASLQSALLTVSQDQLNPGAKVTAQYTFSDTATSMQLEFSCLIKRHYEDGMKLAITVTK